MQGGNKPKKEFFDYAFKVTGAKPDTTILIGDNYDTDIIGALNAGIDSILFNRWNIKVNELQRKPTFLVSSLQEIKDIL